MLPTITAECIFTSLRYDPFVRALAIAATLLFGRLQIQEIAVGSGPQCAPGDLVTFHYLASNEKGKVLADSEKRGLPYRMVLGEKINPTYFEAGLKGMRVGGERLVRFGPGEALGREGAPPMVAPGTALVLRIRLVRCSPPTSERR